MSRAFTREPDADAAATTDVLPDRPSSEPENFVTPLVRSVLGRKLGDSVSLQGRELAAACGLGRMLQSGDQRLQERLVEAQLTLG